MSEAVAHFTSAYVDGIQWCTRCEAVLLDERDDDEQSPGFPESRWVTVVDGNATTLGKRDDATPCKPVEGGTS